MKCSGKLGVTHWRQQEWALRNTKNRRRTGLKQYKSKTRFKTSRKKTALQNKLRTNTVRRGRQKEKKQMNEKKVQKPKKKRLRKRRRWKFIALIKHHSICFMGTYQIC